MKCYHCRKEIKDNSLICLHCGAPKIKFSRKELITYYIGKYLDRKYYFSFKY